MATQRSDSPGASPVGRSILDLQDRDHRDAVPRAAGSLAVSLSAHAAVLLIAVAVAGRLPVPQPEPLAPPVVLVWELSDGGGDLGGGERAAPKLARPVQAVGRDAVTVPIVPPPSIEPPTSTVIRDPTPHIEIPAVPSQSGVMEVVGIATDVRGADLIARGLGDGPGANGRRGPGDGPGDRAGSGDPDGVRPGNGVSWPRLLREVKPNYTPDAMRAQVEGLVELDIVVLEDGTVGRVNIVRSLDARFGLDQEAINAVRRWRFEPGRRMGKAVATRVGVELSFTLR